MWADRLPLLQVEDSGPLLLAIDSRPARSGGRAPAPTAGSRQMRSMRDVVPMLTMPAVRPPRSVCRQASGLDGLSVALPGGSVTLHARWTNSFSPVDFSVTEAQDSSTETKPESGGSREQVALNCADRPNRP